MSCRTFIGEIETLTLGTAERKAAAKPFATQRAGVRADHVHATPVRSSLLLQRSPVSRALSSRQQHSQQRE
jgi:hypothetical protein